MKKNKDTLKQFLIFAAGGGVNIVLNLGLTYLLTDVFHIYYLLSFAIVQIFIIIYGYVYNTFLTFKLKKASTWVFVKFITFLHIFALINILLVRFFTDVVGLKYLLSIIITIFVTIVFRFLIYKRYVFVDDNSQIKKIITANCRPILLGAVLFVVLLFVYGFVPGLYLDDLSAHYLMSANTDCLLNQGIFKLSYCQNYGYPHGHPFLMGLPFIYLSAIIAKIFFINSYLANIITGAFFILSAFIGTTTLLARLKSNKYLAVIFGFLWLANPIIFQQAGYHYLMYGFALLPAYILVDLIVLNKIKKAKNYRSVILWIALLAIARTFSMFMDGYSFIISGLATFIIHLILSFSQKYSKDMIAKIFAGIIICNVIAIGLYNLYSGTLGGYSVMPLDFFRGQGIDLITFFIPNDIYWWADLLKLGYKWGDSAVSYSFWGDGSNVYFSYLSFSLTGVLIAYIFAKFKKDIIAKSIIVVGIIALVISFGPSIKINNTREQTTYPTITFDDYLMPANKASLNMPYGALYLATPGLNNMRAIHRWLLLFKLVLVIIAAITLSQLFRDKKYKLLAYILLVVILAESFPNLAKLHDNYTKKYDQLQSFDNDVIDEMKNDLTADDKVYFISNENDYLANYIAAQLNILTYNTGVDKNQDIAEQYWPDEINNIKNTDDLNKSIQTALTSKKIDKIVYPYFNLRWNSYYWPPDQSSAKTGQNAVDQLENNSNGELIFDHHQHYSIISLPGN